MHDFRDDKEQHYFKEYSDIPDDVGSNFLIIEVAGDLEKVQDLRYTIEKLEFSGIGMTAILDLREMALFSLSLKMVH